MKRYCGCIKLYVLVVINAWSFIVASPNPQKQEPGLLFYLSGSQGFKADYAEGGTVDTNFLSQVRIIRDGAKGPGFECGEKQLMSYWAPGNIYAERGTLSFFWRARTPVGKTEFPIFRVGYADHSSWDMVWLRIDYNGHGFDAFVTDVNLARVRVSTTVDPFPKPDQWIHLAFTWDETVGVRLYVNGKQIASKDSVVVLYAGLDQFGPHSRVISPAQVQSAYNFQRGGDIDEIKIYDRMLSDVNIMRLAKGDAAGEIPKFKRSLNKPQWNAEWCLRNGWNREGDIPPYLDQPFTRVRKVEIHDVYDLKRWWWKGTDGIRETTWPGVYNRSRLPGRNDYFQLPDWDCYSLSGKSVTFFMPDEPWNHIEISGAAWGTMSLMTMEQGAGEQILFRRPQGQEKTFHRIASAVRGQKICFTNVEQETPLGELSAYHVDSGKEPDGIRTLKYRISALALPVQPSLEPLMKFIHGRYLPDEQTVMIASPAGLKRTSVVKKGGQALPFVHVLIPCDSRAMSSMKGRLDSAYTWETIDGGLDGIAIDLPAMNVKSAHGGFIPMNIQIKDPQWPMRNMLDFSFSVKPGEPRTLWLDTRDRILENKKSLYFTLASADAGFGPHVLEGMQIRLIFKSRNDAVTEHVQDRFAQVRDNYANLVEERANDPRLNLYNRFEADIKDLLRIEPHHYPGQNYWYDLDHHHGKPPFVQPIGPKDVPGWAFRQVEDLRYFQRFVLWWIDHRQIENGELGGGLSDDDDLTNCWPAAALMGYEPKKICDAVLHLLDAIYDQGMFTHGLSTIQTDGLHAHEEGIEAQTQAFLVDYGSPKQLERMMETIRALDERIMVKNSAGHRHFRSSYFSGTTLANESVWEWALQPQEYLLLQPVITLAEYNGNPRARQLALDMADGLLAHAQKDSSGRMTLHTETNFSTDSTRPSPLGSPGMLASSMGEGSTFNTSSAGLQLLWTAYQWTGDQKYLQPLLDLGKGILGTISDDALSVLNLRETWGKKIVDKVTPTSGTDFFRHVAWQVTGKKTYLENYYADQIQESALREYINTEGSLWSDRVGAANRELQRSRLGGVALVRGAIHSGHVVSWNFRLPATPESIALLVPEAAPAAVKILGYVLDKKPVEARMTMCNIEPGTWQIVQGLDTDDDERADTVLSTKLLYLERSKSVQVTFPPRSTTILMLTLKSSSTPYGQRPDLGIGKEDIRIQGRNISVIVHSLGSVDAPATTAVVVGNGKVITSVPVPALQAPLDLVPRTVEVNLTLPFDTDLKSCSIEIDPENTLNEITSMNNHQSMKEITSMTPHEKSSDQVPSLKKQPRLEHLALNVKDPAGFAQWYCKHLGMNIVRKSPPPTNAHFLSDAGGNLLFELYSNTEVPFPDYASLSHLSLHLAFMVDDVKAMRDSLMKAGAKVVDDFTVIPSGDQILMMRDPWGLALQFVKRVSPMLEPAQGRPEHAGLNVPDPVRMTHWYCENLGMKVMREGAAPTYTNFYVDEGRHMILEVYNNISYPVLNWPSIHHLSFHIAFVVDDVRSIRNGLIAAGATLIEDIRATNTGDEVLMLRDPWGIPLQFIKRSEPMLK